MHRAKSGPPATGWRRLLRDEILVTFGALILIVWFAGACTLVTGYEIDYRRGRFRGFQRATPAEIAGFWHVPALITVISAPIVLWRLWKIRK